jgi:DegV family protein with EDD domain
MVTNVTVITDTTACIPKDKVVECAIELVPVEVIFNGRVYRDGIDITPEEFYKMLQVSEKLPTTSGALTNSFLEAYRQASCKGGAVLCITESSKFSGMYNSARLAVEMLHKDSPAVDIEVLECPSAAAGQGLVAMAAARAAMAGESLAGVVDIVRRLMPQVYLFASVDTLNYLVKSGRVPQVAALCNSILKIKPVFSINGGEAYTIALPRSTDNAIKRIYKLLKERVRKGQLLHVAVMHADAAAWAEMLQQQIASHFNCAEIFITEFTPVIGVHTGPGVVGVAFYCQD